LVGVQSWRGHSGRAHSWVMYASAEHNTPLRLRSFKSLGAHPWASERTSGAIPACGVALAAPHIEFLFIGPKPRSSDSPTHSLSKSVPGTLAWLAPGNPSRDARHSTAPSGSPCPAASTRNDPRHAESCNPARANVIGHALSTASDCSTTKRLRPLPRRHAFWAKPKTRPWRPHSLLAMQVVSCWGWITRAKTSIHGQRRGSTVASRTRSWPLLLRSRLIDRRVRLGQSALYARVTAD